MFRLAAICLLIGLLWAVAPGQTILERAESDADRGRGRWVDPATWELDRMRNPGGALADLQADQYRRDLSRKTVPADPAARLADNAGVIDLAHGHFRAIGPDRPRRLAINDDFVAAVADIAARHHEMRRLAELSAQADAQRPRIDRITRDRLARLIQRFWFLPEGG